MTSIEPDDREPILRELRGLRGDTRALTAVVRDERQGRRQAIRLTRLALFALVGALALALTAGGYATFRYVKATEITCEQRADTRADIRAGIQAAADEVAAYADVPADERAELNRRVAERVRVEVGPPDCG